MSKAVEARFLRSCPYLLYETGEPGGEGRGAIASCADTHLAEQLAFPRASPFGNELHKTESEKLRMDRDDPFTGRGFQSLVCHLGSGRGRHYEACNTIGQLDVSDVQLARLIESQPAKQGNERYPEPTVAGAARTAFSVAMGTVATANVKWRGENRLELRE
jgi:hypothetical protein